MWAKQSTAATLIVGPILDSTGAEYTSAVIGDLSISKNGGTLTALAAAATLTHIANGQYTLVMTTGNLDTLGRLQITCNKSTYQMPPIGLNIVPAMVFDSMVLGTDVLQSDVTQFGGTAGTFAAGIPTVALDSTARVKLDASQPDYTPATAANLALAKAILDKIDTGLVVDGAVYQFTANMLELGPSSGGGTDWTANERTAIRSILGVPASGTTPADPTIGILDTIRDSVGTYIAGISAVASTTTGTIVGFPSSLNLGDSYTEEANSDIHVFIRDENGDPITAVGDFNFTDTEFAPEVNITQSGSTGRVKAIVTYVDPGAPESYLKVEIPSSQSRRASPGTATVQCLLKWVDTDGKVLCQKTLSKQAVTWNEMV